MLFPNGNFLATGLMFASAIYRVLVPLHKLHLMECQGVLAYHINSGNYGETSLDGLNVIFVGGFKGNAWAGEATDAKMGFFFDERGNEKQREALQRIFMGKAGGFMAEFAKFFGDIRGIEFVPIRFEIAKDLAYWSAEIPGKVVARAEALTGPMTPQDEGTDPQPSWKRDWTWHSCNMGQSFG